MYGNYKTGIVIPCFNEHKRLNVALIDDYIKNTSGVMLLFVDDGSTDNTKSLLQQIDNEYSAVSCFYLDQNQGKAEAVRQGINHLLQNGLTYVGYFDADFSTPLSCINTFIEILEDSNEQLSVVIGSRVKRSGSEISRKLSRHIIGRIFATLISYTLGLPVYDTQCGAKIFRREVAENVFSERFQNRWLFDVEIFARCIIKLGYKNTNNMILEYPLEIWKDAGDSRIKFKDSVKLPFALLKLYVIFHHKIKKIKIAEANHDKKTKKGIKSSRA
ncbi:MAG: glycosyltransferase [Bacteroidetes bacterium]|jgi:glycosyltransferase involved in cell wall biosynthesis|nr:glycosyltransferase [Bacteroidota bacterium]